MGWIWSSGEALARVAAGLDITFEGGRVLLDGEDLGDTIRSESAGMAASRVAAHPAVRAALLDWQRAQARAPGLVADGRDMGTVVFPGRPLKVFLDASPEERATRRYKQLKGKGLDANLPALVADIRERDERDRNRPVAPLRPADDAVVVDSTTLSIDEVLDRVLEEVRRVFPAWHPEASLHAAGSSKPEHRMRASTGGAGAEGVGLIAHSTPPAPVGSGLRPIQVQQFP